jgi:tetratricopeptide (TPR) repeat protein
MPGGETTLIVERLANSQGIATMRLSALFDEHWRSSAADSNPRLHYTRGDGMHPSPRGAQVAAAALKAYLDDPARYALKRRGKPDPIAVAAARSLSDPAPNQAAIFSNVGNRLLELNQPDQAQRYYRMALELSPDDALIHNNLGAALLRVDQLEQARQHFQIASQLNPRLAPAHANLGQIAFQEGRLDDAVAAYRAALALTPDDFDTQYAIGRALAATGELDQAIEHWRVACALDELASGPMTMLAWSLATHPDDERRQPVEAIALATRAVQLTEGHDAMALDALGAAFAADGQFTKAADAARAAIAVGHDSPMLQPMRRRLSMYQRGEPYVASP